MGRPEGEGCGTDGGKNLEHAPSVSILDELEEREAVLRADPELVHRL